MENRRAWARGLCEALLAVFVLPGIFWIFLGKYLTGEYSVSTFQDNTHFLLPLFAHISRSFAAGEFPYWINSIVGGIPLYNTPQFSVLYPLYFFGWNLYKTPLDTSLHIHYITLLHVGILLLNTYIMLRVFRLRIIPSVLGATLFAFSANTYWYLFWVNIISPYSWVPLALAAVFLILEDEYPKTGLVLGWISIYLITSASPAQPLIHFVYCAGFLTASYGFIHRTELSKLKIPLRNLILLAAGSMVLSAATLVPTLIFSQRDMIRWTEVGAVIGNERIPFAGFTTGQTTVSELAKVFFPLSISQVMGNSYLGILPVFLALFAVLKAKQNWIVVPLFCLALYGLLSSTGVHLGFAYINYVMPLLNKIREPSRHLYVFALAACTLAAFGFDHLTDVKAFRILGWRRHGFVFAVFVVLFLASYSVRQRYATDVRDSVLLWSFGLFLGLLLTYHLLPQIGRLGQAVLAAIAVFPMLWFTPPMVRLQDGDYFMEENLRSHRVLNEVAKSNDIKRYRLLVEDGSNFNSQYWSMNAIYYGLRTFQAFMNPLPYIQWTEMYLAPRIPRYAELLGAKYLLSCEAAPAVLPGYSLEREIEGCKLYATTNAQPYYFLSTEIEPYSTVEQFFEMIERSSDLNKVSIPSKDAGRISGWLTASKQPLNWRIVREEHSRNRIDLELQTNRKSLLILNEYFRSEWQVVVNGQSQKPLKVNLNQIGVLLPEGRSRVSFEYRPRLFVWLVYLQRAALVALGMGIIGMGLTAIKK